MIILLSIQHKSYLKLSKSLGTLNGDLLDLQYVETDGLTQWTALTNSNLITNSNIQETWRQVCRDVSMSLFVSVVLLDVVQVVTTQYASSLHLQRSNGTGQDSTTNRNITSKWAFLVNVVSFNSVDWCLEAQTYVTNESTSNLLTCTSFVVQEDSWLLLESFFSLYVSHSE